MTMQQTVKWLLARAERGVPTNVAALNAGKVAAMNRDAALMRAMLGADLVVPDGKSIVWAAGWAGDRIPERVPGIDLMMATMAGATEANLPVYLLGAEEQVLERAVAKLRRELPKLAIAGAHHGYFEQKEELSVLRDIQAAHPAFLYLGMSSPKKELWVARHREDLTVPVVLGVGGSFDILAGVTKRAPRFMQEWGMEWMYRLVQEPRRMWRRYLVDNFIFLGLALVEGMRARSAQRRRAS